MNGAELTFHLAGINNQNFIMRDEQTGTYWQQISGRAISGPMAGAQLQRVASDELTFALWRKEQPEGTILRDEPRYASEYSPRNWDIDMRRVPVVISYRYAGLQQRDVMLGILWNAEARAFRYEDVLRETLVQDRVGGEPLLLVTGADRQSVRAFSRRLPRSGEVADFYRTEGADALMIDSVTGSKWTFQGCASFGASKGACLTPVQITKDYWFDWRNYNPRTTVWQSASR